MILLNDGTSRNGKRKKGLLKNLFRFDVTIDLIECLNQILISYFFLVEGLWTDL